MFTFTEFPPTHGEDISFDKDAARKAGIDMFQAGSVLATLLIANVPAEKSDQIQAKYGELKDHMVHEAFGNAAERVDRVNFNSGFWAVVDQLVGEKLVEEARIGVEA